MVDNQDVRLRMGAGASGCRPDPPDGAGFHFCQQTSTFRRRFMSNIITISFGPEREYEFNVHEADKAGMQKDQARAWLAKEFETLECTPSNPMGKVLVLDMILNVAKYGGEERFKERGDWAKQFAAVVAVGLDRPAIRVDVAGFVVG
jgi:hypothetical protein